MKRAVYALRLWRWWPPVLWARLTNRGQYDPYADMTWRTAWYVAGLVAE